MENKEKTEKLEQLWEDATKIYADCLKEIYASLLKLDKARTQYRMEHGIDIVPKEIKF